jgi:methylase of polypeptide subunit release factors
VDGDGLIEALGYREAPGFLDEPRWHEAIEHAHVFRHTAEACRAPSVRGRFRGTYMLGMHRTEERRATTPVVYVAEAPSAQAADAIHHIVWNQAVVPFLVVRTPDGVRLYTGFDYEPDWTTLSETPRSQRGVLEAAIAFGEVASKLDALRAERIDAGDIWGLWGDRIDPARRVDVRLLHQLAMLGQRLREDQRLLPAVAHALIGRFVYLRYLRERNILSDNLLRSWDIDPVRDLGRHLRLKSFRSLLSSVDERLNGSLFPLPLTGESAPSLDQIQMVAGVMLGDDVESGQLHLDFRAYDFSHIPVETLSAIYEQFMAAEGRDRSTGGFYTPVSLVNFVLGELDDLRPLRPGMRVLDPACGSGAFLVQCYQLLIERRRHEVGGDLAPRELREMLTAHIFGMDRDEDACRVTEFSLALALLDQIPAETLTRLHNFKLPDLHGTNICCGDFFDAEPVGAGGYDWIVGNPPWVTASSADPTHRAALRWMKGHQETHPVSGHQIAEAFAWRAPDFLRPGGVVAFVMPATTLFKEQRTFRERFLERLDVKAVVNLTNLRRVLFDGRAETPAAVLFYTAPDAGAGCDDDITVYSPLVANQEAIRPPREGERRATWTITVDHGEVSYVSRRDVACGDPLAWKIAMWGGPRDAKLLRKVAGRFPSLEVAAADRLIISEGLPLRDTVAESRKASARREALVHIPAIAGEPELLIGALRRTHHVHSFPESALSTVRAERAYVRKRGGLAGLEVCKPPHVIIHAARAFAVFTERFVVIPPPQVGIAGKRGDEGILRALALYLGSDFAWYHQFLTSPEMEYRGRSPIEALRRLPVPAFDLFAAHDRTWSEVHAALVALSDTRWTTLSSAVGEPDVGEIDREMEALERTVNRLTARALELSERDQWLVEDLVHVRRHLADGKIGDAAVGPPNAEELRRYAQTLRDELDAYLDRGRRFRHAVTVVHEARAGMIQIAFATSPAPHEPVVEEAASPVGRHLRAMRERIDREHGQWLYFDRNLVMYLDDKVFLSKPMQRLWWTRSQALADADRIIADLVAAGRLA